MAASIEEIEDRLEPINAILRRLEFGAARDRLRIRLRRLTPAHVQVFMRDLRALSAGSSAELGDAELEKRFTELSRFMVQLRKPSQAGDAGAAATDRDRLLDVRRHVEISAERYDHTTGELRATYRTLGEKSGGESQELVAFIVGSALRFRLGDETRSRPRFAPVFLDEGFVEGRLGVRRPGRPGLEGAGLPADHRGAARQGDGSGAAHGRAARHHQEQRHAPVVDHPDHPDRGACLSPARAKTGLTERPRSRADAR